MAEIHPPNAIENDKVNRENDKVNRENDKVNRENDKVAAENNKVNRENDKVNFNLSTILNVRNKTRSRIEKIINFIGEDWFTTTALFEISGLKSKSSFTHTIIDRLLESSIIRLENPDSPQAPNQRYGLTVKGKAIYYAQKGTSNE